MRGDPSEARPEFETDLPPPGSSGPRNHDVWIRGRAGERKVGVGIEAKADEAFDRPLAAKLAYASKRAADGQATDMPERLQILGEMLFGPSFVAADPRYADVLYQLVAGAVGTAIQAARDGADTAVFVVHEFSTSKTSPTLQAKNTKDLDVFVRLLPGGHPGIIDGRLIGPITIEASAHTSRAVTLYVGKTTENI